MSKVLKVLSDKAHRKSLISFNDYTILLHFAFFLPHNKRCLCLSEIKFILEMTVILD